MKRISTNKNQYTDEERRFLLDNYKTTSLHDLADMLGRTVSSVKSQCFRQGLTLKRKKKAH